MTKTVFLPGFSQKKSMYSRLEVFPESTGIDIVPKDSWSTTISNISNKIGQDSLLVGYSMGARIALGIAIEFPGSVRALVLISGHAGLQDENLVNQRLREDTKLADDFESSIDRAFSVFDENLVFDQNVLKADQINQHRIMDSPFYEERLNELRIPVLYLSGSRDPKFCELNMRYNKKTPFSHHRVLDSDHRVVQNNPLGVSLNINWFSNNFL